MKLILIPIIILAPMALSLQASAQDNFKIQGTSPLPYFTDVKNIGWVSAINVEKIGEKTHRPFGSVIVWSKSSEIKTVQINGLLSNLDDLCKVAIAANSVYASGRNSNIESCVTKATELFGGQPRVYPMKGLYRRQYLKQMSESIDKELFEKLKDLLPEYEFSIEDSQWKVSYVIVTDEGAVEKKCYSGTVEPFSIKKMVVEIVAPVGTIPQFNFMPSAADESD